MTARSFHRTQVWWGGPGVRVRGEDEPSIRMLAIQDARCLLRGHAVGRFRDIKGIRGPSPVRS